MVTTHSDSPAGVTTSAVARAVCRHSLAAHWHANWVLVTAVLPHVHPKPAERDRLRALGSGRDLVARDREQFYLVFPLSVRFLSQRRLVSLLLVLLVATP